MFSTGSSSEVLGEQACGSCLFGHVPIHRGMLSRSRGKRQDLTGVTCFAGLGKISDSESGRKQVSRAQSF